MSDAKETNLTPAELKAVLEHKQEMENSHGKEVTIEDAIQHFILHVKADWLKEKQRRDTAEQIKEIEKHKYFRSMDAGRDIGKAAAAEDWCAKYAPIWRAEHESLECHGFLSMHDTIRNDKGLHVQPSSTITQLVDRFDAKVYMHRKQLDYYNFILQGKKYLNVKSILGLLSVTIPQGEELEFIATGPQAREALDAIGKLIESGFTAKV